MANLLIIGSDRAASEIPIVIAESAGHTVSFATIDAASARLADGVPHAIVVEAEQALPLSRLLHQLDLAIPVIALAPPLTPAEDFAMQQLGIRHLLFKPYSTRQLVTAIRDVLPTVDKAPNFREHVMTNLLNLMSLTERPDER